MTQTQGQAACQSELTCFDLSWPSAGVAHLQMKRKEQFNSMNWNFWHELPKIVRQLDEAGEARVLVISSTGKHFTAGMDLSVFQDPELLRTDTSRHRERFRRLVLTMQDAFNCLETCRMPVIAAIQGGCIGAGVDMISACDLRYAVKNAYFSIEETNVGIMADLGTLQRLPKLIPSGIVRELAYTGDKLSAERAAALGLVNALFENEEELLTQVLQVATKIASKSPLVVAGTKEAITYVRDHSLQDALAYTAAWQASIFSTKDIGVAVAARKENKAAEFENLLSTACKN